MGDAEHPDYSRREMVEMMREANGDGSLAFAAGAFFGIIVGGLAVYGTMIFLQ